MAKFLPCDIDTGTAGSQGSMYYEHDINAGPLPGDTFKEILKGVTTGVASRYMVENNVSNHYQCIANINDILNGQGLGKIAVKGGLALRIVLNTLLKSWVREVHTDKHPYLEEAREYMMNTYAAPSDLDTGLYMHELSRLDEGLSLARTEIVRMRDDWTVKDNVLQDIVSECNDVRDETILALQAAGLDVVSMTFIANKQADQHIELVNSTNDSECPYNECTKVNLQTTHSIFISDNSGLVFQKGHNIADFHLMRAKWAVGAEIVRANGEKCVVNCPAELIDIASPRQHDSRAPQAATIGTQNMKTYVNAAGVKLPAVNLKFQMLDVIEMVQQAMNGANDPKVGKRINRLIIMTTLKNLDGYNHSLIFDDDNETDRYDKFVTTDRWQDLMLVHTSNTALAGCVKYIEHLESIGEIALDQQLLTYLFFMRDVYVERQRTRAMKFDAKGGKKHGERNLVTGLVCAGVTLMMGLFPR